MKKSCALVLGGHINGYSIIRELNEKGVEDILLLDFSRSIGSFSNKIKKFLLVKKDAASLLDALDKLHSTYSLIVVYPTNDLYLEDLFKNYEFVKNFCFLPFNEKNLIQSMDKSFQYASCERLNIPYPKTIILERPGDLKNLDTVRFPIIIKPNRREDLKKTVFRNIQIYSTKDLAEKLPVLREHLNNGLSFLVSEIIPGDGSNIFSYVGYRSKEGNILNEWTGRKLAQFPNNFGVFSSASNQAPDEVFQLGRTLIEGMDLTGIVQPEFKYDCRDKKYKLMEINLRSMMWHRVGNISGVNIQYTQYLDATGKGSEKQIQNKSHDYHFVYFQHEFYNLMTRKNYGKTFIKNIFKSDKTFFAVFNCSDLKPALIDILRVPRKFKERNV
jgi:D-aspartate ligase